MCKKLDDSDVTIEYEEIDEDNISNQIEIVRRVKDNMKKRLKDTPVKINIYRWI